MSSPTDTNQASEDKLMRQLGFRYEPSEGGYYIHKFVKNPENPSSLNSVLVPEVAKQIQDLIRTEKLKLLAEVRERVVGEDEVSKARPDKLRQSPPWQRNQLRNDQRIALTAIEGELLGNINGINIETDDSVPSGMVYIKGKE